MYGLVFSVAMVAALGAADLRVAADTLAPRVPRGWLQNDPADSLYRRARETLNRRDFRAAADLFAQISARYPKSGYAADALYWQAFALYRAGGDRDLRVALGALQQQREKFPKAATKGRRRNPGASDPGRAGPAWRPGSGRGHCQRDPRSRGAAGPSHPARSASAASTTRAAGAAGFQLLVFLLLFQVLEVGR